LKVVKWKWLVGVSVFWLLPLAVSAEDLGAGRISFIQGQAQIQPAGAKEWQLAAVNVPIRTGDRFWTPEDARMELQFQNGTILRMDYKSTLDVLTLDAAMIQVHLSQGHVIFRVRRKPSKTIQVDLPDSTLVVQDKALFRVDIAPDGSEEFGLFQGTMQIATAGRKTHIRTGEMLALENGSAEVSLLKSPDEWEQWNTERDQKQIKAETSAPYLAPELNAYADDLNGNGDWVNVPDYGYCWEPQAGVSADWAPYRLGNWLWMDDDWLWVSSESWGWAPYHFGRWISFSNRWCWVPPARNEIHWGRGYVGWSHTSHYVGWVPLAPGEEFRRGVAFQGEFHNSPHPGAVTVAERSGFAGGRVIPVTHRGNIFASGKAQVGLPDIHPAGNVHIGSIVPANRLPAQSIRSLDIQQLRQQHPPLRVVPPQTHQYRSGYIPQGTTARGASRGGSVWGKRSIQHMWWVSPKASGNGGNAVHSNGNVHGGNNGSIHRGEGGSTHGGRR
jgi:hypothetical protein